MSRNFHGQGLGDYPSMSPTPPPFEDFYRIDTQASARGPVGASRRNRTKKKTAAPQSFNLTDHFGQLDHFHPGWQNGNAAPSSMQPRGRPSPAQEAWSHSRRPQKAPSPRHQKAPSPRHQKAPSPRHRHRAPSPRLQQKKAPSPRSPRSPRYDMLDLWTDDKPLPASAKSRTTPISHKKAQGPITLKKKSQARPSYAKTKNSTPRFAHTARDIHVTKKSARKGGDSSGGGAGGGGSEADSPRAVQLSNKVQAALKELENIKLEHCSSSGEFNARPVTAHGKISADDWKKRPSTAQSRSSASASSPSAVSQSTSSVKLGMVQGVMKKLYQKNQTLKEENKQYRGALVEAGLELPVSKLHCEEEGDAEGKAAGVDDADEQGNYAKSHLLFLLSQREQRLGKLQQELDQSQRRVEQLEKERKRTAFANNPSALPPLPGGAPAGDLNNGPNSKADPYTAQYARLRNEYHTRLNERLARIKLSIKIPKQALYMITQLQRHLISEATQRAVEKVMFNARIYSLEKQMAEHFVQGRLWSKKHQQLEDEVQKRDQMAQRIEAQVYTILERSHKLEKENARLKDPDRPLTARPDTASGMPDSSSSPAC